jgi:hypothetical protein
MDKQRIQFCQRIPPQKPQADGLGDKKNRREEAKGTFVFPCEFYSREKKPNRRAECQSKPKKQYIRNECFCH